MAIFEMASFCKPGVLLALIFQFIWSNSYHSGEVEKKRKNAHAHAHIHILSFATIFRLHPPMYTIRYVSIPEFDSVGFYVHSIRFEGTEKKSLKKKKNIHIFMWKNAKGKQREERTKTEKTNYLLLSCM